MSIDTQNELLKFHLFLGQQIESKQCISPEEAVELWRELHPSAEQIEDDRQAILEALEELNSGEEGMSLEEFDQEFRRQNGLGENR
jgi:hypothetical protein